MAGTPVIEQTLEEILVHVDPELDYHANWTPAPDPPVDIPVLTGGQIHWSQVFDFAAKGLRTFLTSSGGTPIANATIEQVHNASEAAMGQTIKALSGFINQTAGMTLQLARLVDATAANIQSNALNDFRTNSERIDKLQAHNDSIDAYVVPALQAQIVHNAALAKTQAAAAQIGAEKYAVEKIFAPVYTELLKVQPAIDASIKANNPVIVAAAQSKVNALHDLLAPTITALAAGLGNVKTDVEECLKPMCETMGPKTDLGKLLKALKFALAAAAIADLLSLTEPELVARLTEAIGHVGSLVGDFEGFFTDHSRTLGDILNPLQ